MKSTFTLACLVSVFCISLRLLSTDLATFSQEQKAGACKYLCQKLNKTFENVEVTDDYLSELLDAYIKDKFPLMDIMDSKPEMYNGNSGNKNVLEGDSLHHVTYRMSSACDNVIPITPSDIGQTGFTISTPGNYCLTGDVNWNPVVSQPCIRISSSNVSLDLNNARIITTGSSRTAIAASGFLSDILVKNGTIQGFDAGSLAIAFSGCSSFLIENINIVGNPSSPSNNLYSNAIQILDCNGFSVKNVFVHDSGSPTSTNRFDSIVINGSRNFILENCHVYNNEFPLTSGSGYALLRCTNGQLKNCSSNYNHFRDFNGFLLAVLPTQITLENCVANYNKATLSCFGFFCIGSNYITLLNCESSHNLSECKDLHGIPYFFSNNGLIKNCRCNNNQAINPNGGLTEKATGIEVFLANNCVVEDCVCNNNEARNPIRHVSSGITVSVAQNIVVKNCVAIGNKAMGFDSRGVGFGPALDSRWTDTATGVIFQNCIAEGNTGDTPEQSLGFDLYGFVNSSVIDCISQNNGIGIHSNGPYDLGIPADPVCGTPHQIVIVKNKEKNVLIKGNIVTGNSFAGIFDTSKANNCYLENVVYNNGKNYCGSIFHKGTPLRCWKVTKRPCKANNNDVVGDNLDNFNIIAK